MSGLLTHEFNSLLIFPFITISGIISYNRRVQPGKTLYEPDFIEIKRGGFGNRLIPEVHAEFERYTSAGIQLLTTTATCPLPPCPIHAYPPITIGYSTIFGRIADFTSREAPTAENEFQGQRAFARRKRMGRDYVECRAHRQHVDGFCVP